MAFSENQAKEVFFNRLIGYTYELDGLENGTTNVDPYTFMKRVYKSKDSAEVLARAAELARLHTGMDMGYALAFKINKVSNDIDSKPYTDAIILAKDFDKAIESQGQIGPNGREVMKYQLQDMLAKTKDKRVYDVANSMANPHEMIRYDLYHKEEDVGSLTKRILPSDFYEEHEYHKLNEVIYKYNANEAEAQASNVGLHNIEASFLGNFEADRFTGSADEIREQIIRERDEADATIKKVEDDRYNMRTVKDTLTDSKRSGKSLYETLLKQRREVVNRQTGETAYRYDNDYAEYVLTRLNENASEDRHVLQQTQMFLSNSGHMNIPGEFTERERQSTQRMLNKVTNMVGDTYEAKGKRYASYRQARSFKSHYSQMMTELTGTQKELATDFKEWMNFYRGRDTKTMDGKGLDHQEAWSISEHARRLVEIDEANKHFASTHSEQIEANQGLKMQSPLNQIRGEVDRILYQSEQPQELRTSLVKAIESNDIEAYREIMGQMQEHAEKLIDEPVKVLDEARYEELGKKESAKELNEMTKDSNPIVTNKDESRASQSKTSATEQVDASVANQDVEVIPETIEESNRINPDNEELKVVVSSELEGEVESHLSETRQAASSTIANIEAPHEAAGTNRRALDIEQSFQSLRELYNQDPAKFNVSVFKPREESTRNNKRWTSLAANNTQVVVPGDKVAHSITGFDNNYVSLQADYLKADELNIRINASPEEIKAELHQNLQDGEDIRYASELSQEEQRIVSQNKVNETFVEVLYQKEWVNEKIKDKNEQFFERLKKQEALFKEVAESVSVDTSEIQIANVSVHNLMEQFHSFMSRVDPYLERNDPGIKINDKHYMPQYLQDMIRSHAGWMQTVGSADNLSSLAMESLGDALMGYADKSKPIDLTEKGFRKMWEAEGRTESEIEGLAKELDGKNAKKRLEEYIFTDVLANMHQNWFEEASAGERSNAIDNLLADVQERLINVGKIDGSNTATTGSAEQVSSTLKKAKGLINKMPHYAQALQLSVPEIERRLADRYQQKGMSVSFEEHYENVLKTMDDADDYNSIEATQGSPIADRIEPPEEMGRIETDVDVPQTEILDDLTDEQHEKIIRSLTEGMDAGSTDDVEAFLDLSEVRGDGKVLFNTVDTEGNQINGYVYRASGGDMLGYIPDEDRTIRIVNNVEQAQSTYHSSELAPRIFYGNDPIKEDIVSAGDLQRESFGSYEEYQRRGRSVIAADPNETARLAKAFINGEKGLTYIDMETTGVSNSPLEPELIRPLEIYSQKATWDKEQGRIVTNPEDSQHLIVRPTEKMQNYLEQIAAEEDFQVNTDQGTISVLDYENNKVRQKSGEIHINPMDDIIAATSNPMQVQQELDRKSADLWYLRNVAKYGLINQPEAAGRFSMHTGATVVPENQQGEYIQSLIGDARAGMQNLMDAGLQGEGRVMFGDKQVVVSSYDTIAKMVSDFVGDDILAGQNFAEADWSKIIQSAKDSYIDAEKDLAIAKNVLMGDVKIAFSDQVDEIVGDIMDQVGTADIMELNEPREDGSLRKHVMSSRNLLSDIHNGVADNLEDGTTARDIRELKETNPTRYNELVNTYVNDQIDSGRYKPVDLDYKDIAGTIKTMNKFVHNRDTELTQDNMNKLNQLNRNLQHVESIQDMSNPAIKGILEPLNDTGDIDLVPFTNAMERLDHAKENVGSLDLSNRPMIEQMFLNKMANPGERSHNAESQIRAAGLTVPQDSLHMADTDVKMGLDVVENQLQKLTGDSEFMEYNPQALQKGDVVKHGRQLREDMPLGMYEVTNIDNDNFSYTLSGDDGKNYVVSSPSALERNRQFYRHFDYVGERGSEAAVQAAQDFDVDVQRQQLSDANRSSYGFELQQLQSTGDYRQPLQTMKNVYDNVKEPVESFEHIGDVAQHVASSSSDVFSPANYQDAMNKELSPRQQRAYEANKDYFTSEVGKRQGAFLQEVENMQKAGVVRSDQAKQMISERNAAIKEAGRQRRYTRELDNKFLVDNLPSTFGKLEGTNFSLDVSSRKNLIDDLWNQAQNMKQLADPKLPESTQKANVLNQHILPLLKERGYISSTMEGTMPTIDAAARQIMYKKDSLPKLEETDFTRYNEMSADPEFLQAMDESADHVLSEARQSATPMQNQRMEMRDEMIDTLKEHNIYHPDLTIEPKQTNVVERSINFNNPDSLSDFTPNELIQVANKLGNENVGEVDLKNRIFNVLFDQATAGRPHSSEALIEDDIQPRREEARRALNWIDEDGNATPISERYLGMNMPMTKNGDMFASSQIKNLPLDLVNRIEQGDVRSYTRGDGKDIMLDQIGEWRQQGMPGRSSTARDFTPHRTVQYDNSDTVNKDMSINPSEEDILDAAERRRRVRGRGGDGDNGDGGNNNRNLRRPSEEEIQTAAERRNQVRNNGKYVLNDLENTKATYQPEGAIEEGVSNLRSRAKESLDNMATAIKDSGAGKAAAWISGIGVAAYALNQFLEAGDPMKFERRPQGHGVAGIAGDTEDDQSKQPKTNVQMGGTSYQTMNQDNQKPKGYKVKVSGQADSEEQLHEAQKRFQSNIGNAQINIQDSRETYDRSWLEDTMSKFFDRGHI